MQFPGDDSPLSSVSSVGDQLPGGVSASNSQRVNPLTGTLIVIRHAASSRPSSASVQAEIESCLVCGHGCVNSPWAAKSPFPPDHSTLPEGSKRSPSQRDQH